MENLASKADSADADKKIEAIIRTVAAKHGIALGRNDPILILHTLNELLIKDFANKQEELIHQFRLNLEEAADNWSQNTEANATKILGEAKNNHPYLKNEQIESHIESLVLEILAKTEETLKNHHLRMVNSLKSLMPQLKTIKLLIYLNFVMSVTAFVLVALIAYFYLT